jgi:hypothetical protein
VPRNPTPLPPGDEVGKNVDFLVHISGMEDFISIFAKWDKVGIPTSNREFHREDEKNGRPRRPAAPKDVGKVPTEIWFRYAYLV